MACINPVRIKSTALKARLDTLLRRRPVIARWGGRRGLRSPMRGQGTSLSRTTDSDPHHIYIVLVLTNICSDTAALNRRAYRSSFIGVPRLGHDPLEVSHGVDATNLLGAGCRFLCAAEVRAEGIQEDVPPEPHRLKNASHDENVSLVCTSRSLLTAIIALLYLTTTHRRTILSTRTTPAPIGLRRCIRYDIRLTTV